MTPTLPETEPIEPVAEQPAAPADDFGPNNRNLPKSLVKIVEDTCTEAQKEEMSGRRIEMLEGYQNRQYYQDNQYIYLAKSTDWVFSQAYSGAYYNNGSEEGVFGNFLKSYNIVTPYATIQSAKLTENSPGIDFQPEDPSKSEDISASNAAEGMRKDFDRQNDLKELQKKFIYYLQCDGRAVMWSITKEDGALNRKIGTTEIFGALECKVPLYANCREDFWYVLAYKDPDIKIAKSKYRWISSKIQAGETCLSEGEYERMTRLGIVRGSSTGNARPAESISHLITEGLFWLRPAAWCDKDAVYEDNGGNRETIVDEETGQERDKLGREKLDELFPEGLRACFIGKQYAECVAESMDKSLVVAHAYLGSGQHRMPILSMLINPQDEFNTQMNRASETAAFMNDETAIATGDQEFAAITKQQSQPGAWRLLKNLPPDVDISHRMMPIKGGTWDASWQKFSDMMLNGLPQFQLAVPPSIWGEATPGNDTAAGLQLVSAQAMGVLGSLWVVIVSAFAQMYRNNCSMIIADDDYPDEVTVALGEGETVKVQKAILAGGMFKVYPDTQSGFPESTASERQVLDQTVEQLMLTPLASQVFGSPENIEFYLQKKGMPEFVLPEGVSGKKQMREIEQLLKESPIIAAAIQELVNSGAQIPDVIDAIKQQAAAAMQAVQAQHAGQVIAAQANGSIGPPPPPPPDPMQIAKSSIRVWPTDFHTYEAAKCKDWLSSEACYREVEANNTRGILNVMLHMMEHEIYEAQEAPPPPAMPMRLPKGGKTGVGPAPPMPAPAAPGAPGAVQ